MPLFRYEALTHGGGSVKNTLEADSKAELISRLRQMGYWPTTVVEETEEDTPTGHPQMAENRAGQDQTGGR